MAVQSQYPWNAFRVENKISEEFQQLQQLLRDNLSGNLFGTYAGQQILNATAFSRPESELTCNLSGSRKRNREHQMALMQHQPLEQQVSQFPYANFCDSQALDKGNNQGHESGGASTSGRSAIFSPPSLLSPLPQDVESSLYNQNFEIDALIRLQNEKLRSVLEETRQIHCKSLLSALKQKVLKVLNEKEAELENASRRNAGLEEKLKQLSAESQIWFNVAKNNEAILSSLKSSLERILKSRTQTSEGVGDIDGEIAVVDNAQSCCYQNVVEDKTTVAENTIRENHVLKSRKSCKVCRENDVSVHLFPCRHLCLCEDCESKLDSCPICKSLKHATLQIFMS